MVEYRSHSQYKTYKDCPYQYYLKYVHLDENGEKVWQRPAAWLTQGLGVHEAAEEFEKSGRTMSTEDVQDVFRESYVKHTNRFCEETPNFDFWFASGPYKGEADIERRFGLGLEQAARYVDYYTEAHPEEVIWITPEGEPAIELGFDIDLDGVRVKGFIDQVVKHPVQGVHVRDIKSGNTPGDDFQLAVYAVALNQIYGTEITTGDYWMGRQGKPTKDVYNLGFWTREKVAEEFRKVDEGIRAEKFDPKPEESKCRFCPVSASCAFANG